MLLIQIIEKRVQSNLIVITIYSPKLPWAGDSKETFRFSTKTATYPPVYYKRLRLHTDPLIAYCQAEKLCTLVFIIFDLTKPGIKPESTVSLADALFTQ